MSMSTHGTPAPAIVAAIPPPMYPPPTTAARVIDPVILDSSVCRVTGGLRLERSPVVHRVRRFTAAVLSNSSDST
jgi:hypothetical protein